MLKTVIFSAARTSIDELGGQLSFLDATTPGWRSIGAVLEQATVAPDQVEHLVMEPVLQTGQGQILSRQAHIKAEILQGASAELTSPFSDKHMAHEAGEVAEELELLQADLDRWALRSHQLASKAPAGRTAEEIASMTITSREGDTIADTDEGPWRDTSLEGLGQGDALLLGVNGG